MVVDMEMFRNSVYSMVDVTRLAARLKISVESTRDGLEAYVHTAEFNERSEFMTAIGLADWIETHPEVMWPVNAK